MSYDHVPATHAQAFYLLCGKELGRGVSRIVYECKIDPTLVVKVEESSGWFQNVIEWETWKRVEDTPFAKWFAKPRFISDNSCIMVMERTYPVANPKQYPAQMPVFLCDFKRTNYGLAHNREGATIVCHDYGTNLLFEHGMSKRMRKAGWYDPDS